MKNEHAVALGSIKSERKAETARANGKLGGRPRKPMQIIFKKGVVLIDKEDFSLINKHKWRIGSHGYACTALCNKKKKNNDMLLMHNLILGTKKGYKVDHIDNNKLNNQKKNLRHCTDTENVRNRGITIRNKCGFKGVSFNKRYKKKWIAEVRSNYKRVYIGYFDTAEEAYKAYCEACIKYHGEFANFG